MKQKLDNILLKLLLLLQIWFYYFKWKRGKADEMIYMYVPYLCKITPCYDGNSFCCYWVAACVEGTLVNLAAGGEKSAVEFGHPSGTLKVGAVIKKRMVNILLIKLQWVEVLELLWRVKFTHLLILWNNWK